MVDGVLPQAVKELVEESKKSLEEKENEGVDAILPVSMIQNRCIPSEEGADGKPRAETVPKEADDEAVPVEAMGWPCCRAWAGNLGRAWAAPSAKW